METGKRVFFLLQRHNSPMYLDAPYDGNGRGTLREYRKCFVCVCMYELMHICYLLSL